ncbi:MAG TPA: hypothetical protein VME40_05395 [Caulobacteraceae bacterium]|nr:hypothetical protein [Caulobacteraceae bacterium]
MNDPLPVGPAAAEWRRQAALVVLSALGVFIASLLDPSVFADGDTNWHVAAGRWMLAHRAVPSVDPFSFTFAGKPWVAHEWGAEVVLALAWLASGWSGVVLITALAAALTFAVIAAEIAPRLGTLCVLGSLGLALAVLWPLLLARPHMIALPLLAFWLARLLRARRAQRAPPLWLAGVMVLWANLHGSYIFGLAFTAVFALEAILDARQAPRSAVIGWGSFGLAAGVAALATPNGLAGLVFPVRVLLLSSLSDILEWRPADFAVPSPFEVALMMALFVFLYRGVRMGALRLALLLLLTHMALQHIRQEAILAVAAPLLIAEPLGRTLEPGRIHMPAVWRAPVREIAAPLAIGALLFVGLGAWRLARPVVRRDSPVAPITALSHVPPALRAQPVFNDYDFGGWLILHGVRVYIDGRADMYGDAFMKNYLAIERDADPGATTQALWRWKIAWTILHPDSKLAARLDQTPGWRRLYADRYAVVHVRTRDPPDLRRPPPGGAARRG